jgi:hypothetical protein
MRKNLEPTSAIIRRAAATAASSPYKTNPKPQPDSDFELEVDSALPFPATAAPSLNLTPAREDEKQNEPKDSPPA